MNSTSRSSSTKQNRTTYYPTFLTPNTKTKEEPLGERIRMPISIPCALCGSNLSGGTFHYQKHMTQSHWAGTGVLPLPSIYTSPSTCPTPSFPYTNNSVVYSTSTNSSTASTIQVLDWPSTIQHTTNPITARYTPS